MQNGLHIRRPYADEYRSTFIPPLCGEGFTEAFEFATVGQKLGRPDEEYCPICLRIHRGKLKSEVQDEIFGDADVPT